MDVFNRISFFLKLFSKMKVGKLKSGLAVPFHQKVCSYCHSVPKSKEWLEANITDGLHVFHIAKRHKPYQRWEPIYIGTQNDPLYDERLTWEGKSDKMTQVKPISHHQFKN